MYQSLTVAECGCRTRCCPHCQSTDFIKYGFVKRKDDGRRVRRFRCKCCGKTFSRAGFSIFYRHSHRRLNRRIEVLFTKGMTLRGIGRFFGIDKDTVARRLPLCAARARHRLKLDQRKALVADQVQFDELITIEHTKMKPVSVMLVSDSEHWRMLGCVVSRLPASGLLAEKSRQKYGFRQDESTAARHTLMASLGEAIAPDAEFITDSHSAYPDLIRRHFPDATHTTHIGAKGAVGGQGELKKQTWDPLFCINHQLAMLRANISRLFRRSWNTTKRIERLFDHLLIFILHYNRTRRPANRVQREAERQLLH